MSTLALPIPTVDGCWSTGEACKAVGLPVGTNGTSTLVHRLVDAGLLHPLGAKQGPGWPLRWRATDVADLAVAAEVRRIAGDPDSHGSWVALARHALTVWRAVDRRPGWILVSPTEAHAGLTIPDVIDRMSDGSGWLLLPAPTPPPGVEAWPPEPSTQATPGGADSRPAPPGDRPLFSVLRGSEARAVTAEERAALERANDIIDVMKAALWRDEREFTDAERAEYDDALRAAKALGLTRHEIWCYGVERQEHPWSE